MINVVLVVIIAAICVLAARSAVKHFRGESSCCGGGDGTLAEKKVLTSPAVERRTVFIEGMKCSECEAKVWASLNKIDGLSVKKASSKKGQAVYEASRNVDTSELSAALESAGFKFLKVS